MSGIWKYAANIIEKAGAGALSAYALILILGFVMIYPSLKRASTGLAIAIGLGWPIVATFMLVMLVAPKSTPDRNTTPTDTPRDPSPTSRPPLLKRLPATIAVKASGQTTVIGKEFALDLGGIPTGEAYVVNLVATSATPIPAVELTSADRAIAAQWDYDQSSVTVDSDPKGFRLSIDSTDLATGNNQYDLYLKTGQQIVAKIVVKLHALTGRHVSNQLSGLSGLGEQYGKIYSVCTIAPGPEYAVVEKSVKSALTGDRTSCNVWSTCQQTIADNSACLAFSMQGHSENRPDRPHQSIGQIEADYVAVPTAPKLSAIIPPVNGAPRH